MAEEPTPGLTANRLRLVQVTCADENDGVRRKSLEEEVDRAMKSLNPEGRRTFLTELLQEFPAWDGAGSGPVNGAAQTRSQFDDKQLRDPHFLLGKLKALAPGMTSDDKAAIARELDAAGFPMAGKPAWPAMASSELRGKLGMLSTENFDPSRVLEMLAMLAEFAINVEQLAWTTWREIDGENNAVRKQVDLHVSIRKCVTGDANTPCAVVKPGPERLQKLISSIINNVPGAGKWAMAHFKNLSPKNITQLLQLENRLPKFMNKEKALWEEYEAMFGKLNDEAFKAVVVKNIADRVRKDMGG